MGGKGSGNRSGKPRAPGGGRTPTSYRIEQDRPLRISFVSNDGDFSQIAAGPAIIRKTEAGTRLIVVETILGEIRISL